MKTIFKVVLGLVVTIVAGYAAFPQYRPLIIALSPYLLFLTCPLAMYFMMASMNNPMPDPTSAQQKRIELDTSN